VGCNVIAAARCIENVNLSLVARKVLQCQVFENPSVCPVVIIVYLQTYWQVVGRTDIVASQIQDVNALMKYRLLCVVSDE
jgi:hypothetical protein